MDIILNYSAPNAAGIMKLAYDRPELTGSEKQITWAEDLRKGYEKEAITMLERAAKTQVGCVRQDDNADDEVLAPFRAVIATKVGPKSMAEWLDELFAQTEAKFWIENRVNTLQGMLTLISKH